MNETKQRYERLLLDVNKLTVTLNQAQADLDRVFTDFIRLQNCGRSDTVEYQKLRALMESLHKISIDAVRDTLTTLARRIDKEINPVDLKGAIDLLDDSDFYSQAKH